MENTFVSKKKLVLFSRKFFPFILGGKYFLEVVKDLKISYYLLIMSNLVLKPLVATYFFLIFFFKFIP